MATAEQWISGARLRTLPLAVAPVIIGTGEAIGIADVVDLNPGGPPHAYGWFAYAPLLNERPASMVMHYWDWHSALRALLALVVSLALQVGVNYANDYSDGIRGTDDDRVGPFRLTGSGAAQPATVKRAAFICFGVAAVAGLTLVAISGTWWLLLVGAACLLAAWYYTGGAKPYGYSGFGEVAVFVFFGLVPVLGTTYTQVGEVSWPTVAAAAGAGALACAVLVANNLRDIPTDAVTGKLTVAVRIGTARTRQLYTGLVVVAFAATLVSGLARPWAELALLALPLAVPLVRLVSGGAEGRALLPVLAGTGRLALAYAVLMAVGLAL